MIVKAYPPRMSPEQFEELSDSRGLELIDGIIREKKMGTESGSVGSRINGFLFLTVFPQRLGEIITNDARFRCFPSHPGRIRKPDVAFILRERLPDGRVPIGTTHIRPDIAVEVISPFDEYEEVEEKIADYFDAKIPLIWVVSPRNRTVLVYRTDGSAQRLRDSDYLTADPIIPGIRILVADLFPNPPEDRVSAPEEEGTTT